jgi:hypothetical protein
VKMATQLRDYTIRDGELDRWVDEWRTRIAPVRRALGFRIDGAWVIRDESRFVWLLTHSDGWDAFEAADRAYHASPERAALHPDPARLIERQLNARLDEVDPGETA